MASRGAVGERPVRQEEATHPPCNKRQAADRLVLLHHVVRACVRADLPEQSTARRLALFLRHPGRRRAAENLSTAIIHLPDRDAAGGPRTGACLTGVTYAPGRPSFGVAF